jgi:hypothetical protein
MIVVYFCLVVRGMVAIETIMSAELSKIFHLLAR